MWKYFARFFMSNQNTEKTHNSCLESHLSIKVNSCCCFTCWQLLWKKKNTFLNFMPELFYGRPIIFQGLYSTKNSSKMLQKIYHILSIEKLFPFLFMAYLSFLDYSHFLLGKNDMLKLPKISYNKNILIWILKIQLLDIYYLPAPFSTTKAKVD